MFCFHLRFWWSSEKQVNFLLSPVGLLDVVVCAVLVEAQHLVESLPWRRQGALPLFTHLSWPLPVSYGLKWPAPNKKESVHVHFHQYLTTATVCCWIVWICSVITRKSIWIVLCVESVTTKRKILVLMLNCIISIIFHWLDNINNSFSFVKSIAYTVLNNSFSLNEDQIIKYFIKSAAARLRLV